MKCIIIVKNPSLPDILFITADREFKHLLNEQAKRQGFLEELAIAEDGEELDLNVVIQFLSPIIASHSSLNNELNNPYRSITCENGFTFVMKQFSSDELYIGLNGDGEETEEFLSKKLILLHSITEIYFGPIKESIKPASAAGRIDLWNTLGSIINTWSKLYKEEQSFLLEASERLNVNHTLNELCIDLLEKSIMRFKVGGDRHTIHAALTVNTKLLSLYSSQNANEIQAADLLLIALLVQDAFPSTKTLEDLMAVKYRPISLSDNPDISCDEEESGIENESDLSEADEYYSPIEEGSSQDYANRDFVSPIDLSEDNMNESLAIEKESGSSMALGDEAADHWPSSGTAAVSISHQGVRREGERGAEVISEAERSSSSPAALEEHYFTPKDHDMIKKHIHNDRTTRKLEKAQTETARRQLDVEANSRDQSEQIAPPERAPAEESDNKQPAEGLKPHCLTVFLKTPSCNYSPHILHCIPVFSGTTLILISEMKGDLATCICQCHKVLEDIILKGKTSNSEANHERYLLNMLEDFVKKISEILRKTKAARSNTLRILHSNWEAIKNANLQKNLDGASNQHLNRFENAIDDLTQNLKSIFKQRYLRALHTEVAEYENYLKAVKSVQHMMQTHLHDYYDYLMVKGQRNITITTFIENYPGLVHFIYVDRKTNQIIAPSINVSKQSGEVGNNPQKKSLKDKVHWMVGCAHKYLKNGYTSLAIKDKDFLYTYFISFEDLSGTPLTLQKGLKTGGKHTIPSVYYRHFYKNLIRQNFPNLPPSSVNCYEMFCIHVSMVPTQFAITQAHKLSTMLWEMLCESKLVSVPLI